MRQWLRRRQRPTKSGGAALGNQATSNLANGAGQTTTLLPLYPPPPAAVAPSSSSSSSSQTLLPTSHEPPTVTTLPQPQPAQQVIGPRHDGSPGTVKKDYWKMAAEKLQEEDSSLKELIAGVQRAAAAAGNDDFATQLLDATERSRQELESKRWKIHMGAKEIALRKHFDRLVKVVTVLKDVARAAASLDPIHAGLPLAGFCVLMQVWCTATQVHK